MAEGPLHPMAAAMQWVSRVFAAALMMILPGLGGQWIDERWGTRFIGLAGFAVGLVVGVTYLIAATRQTTVARRRGTNQAMGGLEKVGDDRRSHSVDGD